MKYAALGLFLFFHLCYCKPRTITEDNWGDILEGEWMLEFMAPWCPACKSFAETWSKFSDWSRDLDIKVGVVDVTTNPSLSGRFLVASLPTIYHIKDGVFRQYKGSRQETELIAFIDDRKWQEVDVIQWYISPSSIQMATVGQFFKAAMFVRSIYNTMTQDYGIPEWACYIIFAVATILAGLLLGLLIVLCCDMVFPYKQHPYIPPEQKSPQEEGQGDTVQENADADDSAGDLIDDMEPTETKLADSKPEEKDGDNVPRQRRVRKDN